MKSGRIFFSPLPALLDFIKQIELTQISQPSQGTALFAVYSHFRYTEVPQHKVWSK